MDSQRDTRNTDTPTASQPRRLHQRLHHTHQPHTLSTRASQPHTIAIYSTAPNTHRRRDHASLHAACPVNAATDVVLSYDTTRGMSHHRVWRSSAGIVAAPAPCIRIDTRQHMLQRCHSHVTGYTAFPLLHSRDIDTTAAPTRGTHAATTPARQHTTRRRYNASDPAIALPPHRVINAADTTAAQQHQHARVATATTTPRIAEALTATHGGTCTHGNNHGNTAAPADSARHSHRPSRLVPVQSSQHRHIAAS
jgi:hypothetical protein